MNLAEIDPEMLSTALEAARGALRRMDDKHIPAKLRGIASRSGRLPAPLVKRLLAELDASEWLRAEALAELGAEPADDQVEPTASILFLERPQDWVVRLEAMASGHRQAEERSEAKRMELELRRTIAKVGGLEQRLAAAEAKEKEVTGNVEARMGAAAAAHRRSLTRLQTSSDLILRQLESATEEVARLMAENARLNKKVDKLTKEFEKEGAKSRVPNEKAGRSKTRTPWSFDKPADLARHLDDLSRASSVSPAPSGQSKPASGPIGLSSSRMPGPPGSLRPDQAEAIVWLLSLPGPVHIAIDGWNAAHLLKSPPVAATRNRVIEAARRLNIASAGRRLVTAVFDSSQVGETFSSDEVVVKFVPSADEELIRMAETDASRMVVITSDRRVREAVERSGAVGLWSEALIDWLRTAGRHTFSR